MKEIFKKKLVEPVKTTSIKVVGKLKTTAISVRNRIHNSKVPNRTIRVNQNLAAKIRSKKDIRAKKHAEYLATLPKSRVKRFFYRLHPKNVFHYWFSRDGAIMALKIVGFTILALSILIAGVFAYYRKDLPKNITDLKACSLGQTIKFYDRTKTILLWSGAGDIDCRPVALSEMSPYLQNAVIASEDQNFYKHHGFDPGGLVNAVFSNAFSGGEGRGGSTITQQYVKLVLLTPERSLTRKIKELILSVELDASYKKEEILQAYLNEIGFAYQYNGAEAGARGLFDKSAKDLTIDEAAIMAAGIPAPDFYWVQNQGALVQRRDYVIDQMEKLGYITKEEAEAAKKVDTLAKVVKDKSQYKDIKAPHFVLEVYRQLVDIYGKDITKLGLTVTTTLDYELQKAAEEAITNGFACQNGSYGIDCLGKFDNAAISAEDVTTGQVVAQVGSRDFNIPGYGQLNIATTPRSPGSTYKPYDYAALMLQSENWGAGSVMYDLKTNFGGNYRPQDFDNREPGGMSMRYALGNSRNIPAIKAMYIAGIEYTHEVSRKLGVYSGVTGCAGIPNCEGILSTAIGDGGQVRLDEHVHGYASFARLGKVKPLAYVLKVENSKGKVLEEWKDTEGEQAISDEVAYIINDMLSDRNASYFRGNKGYRDRVTNNFEAMDIPAGIKTGTTNERDNGWMLGYTQKYAAGVWIGNHENKSSDRISYENATGPIWGEFMRRAHELLAEKPGAWTRPAGIKSVSMDGALYSALKSRCTPAQVGNVCGFPQSDIFPSWYSPKAISTQKAIIDTVSGKLATECTPELAKKEVTGGAIQPEVAATDPNYKNWLEPIAARYAGVSEIAVPVTKDDKHSCSDVKPSATLSIQKIGTGYYRFSANVTQGTAQLKSVSFKIDGQTIAGGSFEISSPGTVAMDYFSTISGSHDVSVQVIDTLLYEHTELDAGEPFDTVPAITITKSLNTLNWPNTTPPNALNWVDNYQYSIKDSTGAVVKTGSGTSASTTTLLVGSYVIVVDAYKGSTIVQTGTLNFTKP